LSALDEAKFHSINLRYPASEPARELIRDLLAS